MKNRPFTLIGVNTDPKERVQEAIWREDITWRSFWDGGTTSGPIAKSWHVRSWPTIYVIDSEGVIRYKKVRGKAMDQAIEDLVEELIAGLIDKVSSNDPKVRSWAAFRIGRYNAPNAKEILTRLLKDKVSVVRQRAAVGLALLGEHSLPLTLLLRESVRDERTDIRIAALQSLGRIEDQQTGSLAIQALKDQDPQVRRAAVQVLEILQYISAAPALAEAVNDADLKTAKMAALALASIGSPECIAELKKFADDGKHVIRIWIAVALHRVGEEDTSERFERLLGEEEVAIRRQAIRVVGTLTDLDTLDLNLQALDDEDGQVRRVASMALNQSDDPRAEQALCAHFRLRIDAIMPMLSSRDYQQRKKVGSELISLGPAAALYLLERLDEIPVDSLSQFTNIIRHFGNPNVIQPTSEILKDPELETQLRASLETILRSLGDKARDSIIELLSHEQAVVRESGVRVMSAFRDEAATASLQAALMDSAPRVRIHAAATLAKRNEDDAFAVLAAGTKDADAQIRQVARDALRKLDSTKALPIVSQLVEEYDHALRRTAISALGNFKQPQATEMIKKAIEVDRGFASQAMSALISQNTAEAARVVAGFLKDDIASRQQMARSALRRMSVPEAKKLLEQFSAEIAKQDSEQSVLLRPNAN